VLGRDADRRQRRPVQRRIRLHARDVVAAAQRGEVLAQAEPDEMMLYPLAL